MLLFIEGHWGIDPLEGYLYNIYPLDYEAYTRYELRISVQREDGSGSEPAATATLTISVGNDNDEVPTFTTNAFAFTDLTTGTNTNPSKILCIEFGYFFEKAAFAKVDGNDPTK